MTVTIDELEAADLDREIPCELLFGGKMCGKPAAFRAKGTCPVHGWGVVWICRNCRNLINMFWLSHNGCWISMEVEWL